MKPWNRVVLIGVAEVIGFFVLSVAAGLGMGSLVRAYPPLIYGVMGLDVVLAIAVVIQLRRAFKALKELDR